MHRSETLLLFYLNLLKLILLGKTWLLQDNNLLSEYKIEIPQDVLFQAYFIRFTSQRIINLWGRWSLIDWHAVVVFHSFHMTVDGDIAVASASNYVMLLW